MKKQEAFSVKLKSYSLCASAILATTAAADAQVTYTDIIPDYIGYIWYGEYSLDLNNDGTTDYKIWGDASFNGDTNYRTVGIAVYPGNLVARTNGYVGAFEEGNNINSGLYWSGDGILAYHWENTVGSGSSVQSGNWIAKDKKFLALKITSNGETYYDWARLSVGQIAGDFTVFDYAYQKVPDQPLSSGEIPCMILYPDADGDNYGDINSTGDTTCSISGFTTDHSDCNDTNENVYAGAQEITNNGIDDDCDGYVDEFGVGVSEPNAKTSFIIYPNPTDGNSVIQFALPQSSHVSIKVFELSGKEILTLLDDELQQGEHSLQLNTSEFSKGVYLVRMISDAVIVNQKLIVQ